VTSANYGNAFYTNAKVIAAYETYITTLLNHTNSYNGKKWGEDPTVLAWETGNELGAYIGKEGYPPATWTKEIAAVINQYSDSLVIDGSDGFYNYR
jgi:endo-1,4-beta-mannosidase